MKTKLIAVLAAATLSGCASTGELLSMKYCPEVSYTRTENRVVIHAVCLAPYETPKLPVPPAAVFGAVVP
jgi:hypothetical protein